MQGHSTPVTACNFVTAFAAMLLMVMLWPATGYANGSESRASGHATGEEPDAHYIWLQNPHSGETVLATVAEPDTSLWNGARIGHYESSLREEISPALAIMTIDSVGIEVPVYNGTDELQLTRGAGRIKGMARIDGPGNLGISSHRDGFFRGLKDIRLGDDIRIMTPSGEREYSVASIDIVAKADHSALQENGEQLLTLVTCYPFYFVGNAPERFIVRARPKHTPITGS